MAVALETVRDVLPRSTIVTVCEALRVPTDWAGNVSDAVENAAAAALVQEQFLENVDIRAVNAVFHDRSWWFASRRNGLQGIEYWKSIAVACGINVARGIYRDIIDGGVSALSVAKKGREQKGAGIRVDGGDEGGARVWSVGLNGIVQREASASGTR